MKISQWARENFCSYRRKCFSVTYVLSFFCTGRLPSHWRLSSTAGLAVQRMYALQRQVPDQVCILPVVLNVVYCSRTSSFAAVLIHESFLLLRQEAIERRRKGQSTLSVKSKIVSTQEILWLDISLCKCRGLCCTGEDSRVRFLVL